MSVRCVGLFDLLSTLFLIVVPTTHSYLARRLSTESLEAFEPAHQVRSAAPNDVDWL